MTCSFVTSATASLHYAVTARNGIVASGDAIFIEVGGELKLTRIEHSRSNGGYYSVDGYRLREGVEAALPT